MATNTTPEFLRGFLIPLSLDDTNIWNAQSTFTQADSFAGDPTPKQNSPMRLYAKGQQESDSTITIKTKHAGYAGFGAGFTVIDNQTSKEYGFDPQNAISEWMNIKFSSSVSTSYLHPDVMNSDDGDILIVYEDKNSLAYNVRVIKQNQDGTQTDTLVYTQPALSGEHYHPCLCTLPDGSFLLAFLIGEATSANLRTYSSEDGTTWTLRSSTAISDKISVGSSTGSGSAFQNYNVQRMRIAQASGVVLLMIETNWNDTSATKRNRLLQYASADLGGTFSLVTTEAAVDDHSFKSINLYSKNGSFSFVYIGATNQVHYMIIPSGYEIAQSLRNAQSYIVVSSDTVAGGSDDFMTSGELGAWSDYGISDNVVYALLSGSHPGGFEIMTSEDGIEWRTAGPNINGIGFVLSSGDASTTIKNISCSSWTGRSVIVSQVETTATNNSIAMLFLGGYASGVNLPVAGVDDDLTYWNRMGFLYNILGIDLFGNYSILTKTGAGSETLGGSGVALSGAVYYDLSLSVVGLPTADVVGKGLIVRARIESITGGSTTGSERRGIRMSIDDTSEDYEVEVRITADTIYVFDYNATSSPGSQGSLSLGGGVDLLIAFSSGKLNVWYRSISPQSNRRDWVSALSLSGLSDGGGGGSSSQSIRFGHTAYSSGSLDTTWRSLHVANGFNLGEQIHTFSSPTDLSERPYPVRGRYLWTLDNVQISSVEGASYEGDEFDILPTSRYPIENVLFDVSPTPRETWRSVSVGSGNVPEQFIAIKLNPDTSVHTDESLPNDLIGVHLGNINFRTAKLEYYSSGSWTALHTFTTYIRSYSNSQGRTLRGFSGLEEPYLKYNECAGWRVYINTASGYVWRTIVSNSEGKFGGTSTNTKQAVLLLDSEVTASTNAITYLVPNHCTLLANLNGLRVEALGIRIPAQETLENYVQLGILSLGSVVLPGKQYQRGRSISLSAGTQTTTTQGGTRYSRNLRPSQRRLRIGWTEGIDTSELQGASPDPDYWMASSTAGAEPVAVQNDTPDLLLGMIDYLSGSLRPVVYLPLISKTSNYRGLLRADEQIFCTLEGEVEVEHVLGSEFQSDGGEVFRVATLSFLEIV